MQVVLSCNATEVTTHTGQNNHLFFTVCIHVFNTPSEESIDRYGTCFMMLVTNVLGMEEGMVNRE